MVLFVIFYISYLRARSELFIEIGTNFKLLPVFNQTVVKTFIDSGNIIIVIGIIIIAKQYFFSQLTDNFGAPPLLRSRLYRAENIFIKG